MREELEAAAVRLNLLAEAEMYSTDAVMAMSGPGRKVKRCWVID